jgi:hypothetical protein
VLSGELRRIYERAVYEVDLEAGRVLFRIGHAPQGGSFATTLAIVTAWNPGDLRPSAPVNERANARLAAEIEGRGWRYFSALGRSTDAAHGEPSFAVADISRIEAIALGRRYAQAAVFYWDGREASILSCV